MKGSRKLVQLIDKQGEEIGLYSIPAIIELEEVESEYARFNCQDDFEEHNNIGAEREFLLICNV